MRRSALIALAALTLLSLPGAAHASGAVQIRRVDLDRFPLVRVTAVVPKGSRPALAEDGRPADYVTARALGSAHAIVLAVDNSASMTGRPLREAKRAAAGFLVAPARGGPSRPRVLRPRGARADAAARSDIVGGSEALDPRPRHAEGDGALRRRRPVGRAAAADVDGHARPRPAHRRARPRLEEHASPKRSPQRAAPT